MQYVRSFVCLLPVFIRGSSKSAEWNLIKLPHILYHKLPSWSTEDKVFCFHKKSKSHSDGKKQNKKFTIASSDREFVIPVSRAVE